MSAIINLRDVHKAYRLGDRRIEALRGINMVIDAPGFYAIMGASGSGKSTLLHLMAGLDQADSGEITIGGCALHAMNEAQLTAYRRHSVGMIFQQFNLIPTLTALQNVLLPGMLDGRRPEELHERGSALLKALGLSDRAAHKPDALSGGEQQRVAIARALLFSPQVLLADEPTGNLDSTSADQLWGVLKAIAAQRALTVVMVTHEPAAAVHCRSVFVLRDGEIRGTFDVADADPAELAARYQQFGRTQG